MESGTAHTVYLIGMMGAGKTFWGRQLAERLQVPFIDLDEWIVQQTGLSVPEIFAQHGEGYFRDLEAYWLRHPQLRQPLVLACGGGAPCFHQNIDFMKMDGTVVWLHPPLAVLAERLWPGRHKRPLLASAADKAELMQRVEALQAKRAACYSAAHLCVTDEHIDLPALVAAIGQVAHQQQANQAYDE
ncbi:MAG: shikimate kinase [Chitinophagaceae bacterium]|nr:shikimate kinase [Chitinophagaceae bacterium]